MTSLVSVRLSDGLFDEMKQRAKRLHISQTDYVRRAIEQLNDEMRMKERDHRLQEVSLRVRQESMKINAEFSEVEHDPEA